MIDTFQAFDVIMLDCRSLFERKTEDYGTAWRIMRTSSLTDQIFIKAKRIRNIQEGKEQRVSDDLPSEFIGIINYGIMALIQLEATPDMPVKLSLAEVLEMYDRESDKIRELLARKNHDYGEAWRDMRVSSMTDLILMKILRIKEIENNNGETRVSEGLDANYQDIINYAIFCLIKLKEQKA